MISRAVKGLRDKAADIYLDLFAVRPDLADSPWALPKDKLDTTIVRWPRTYQWSEASDWVDVLKTGFRRHIRVDIIDNIPQPYKGTVIFQIETAGRPRDVAIGYSDYMPIDDDCARAVDLYFKMQYDREGYRYDHVVPGGYVPGGRLLYFHLAKMRELRGQCDFSYDVTGRFGLDYAREIREKAVNILAAQAKFEFEGGMKTVTYPEFLSEIARSKICIDLPGLGDFCFRLVNYLAIGSCVIAYPHRTMLNGPLVDGQHIVYCKPDFSDLVDLCEYYLKHDDEREAIANNAREFFDTYLHRDSLVRYYLHTCIERFGTV